MPVTMVRNTLKGPTVIASDIKGTVTVEWSGAGDPMGGDIQPVPAEIVDTVPFHRALQRGILVLENPEDNPELDAAIARQNASWKAQAAAVAEAGTEALDPEANNDLVVVSCIGPDTKGTGKCGADVPVRDQQRDDKPPLCNVHAELASQYVAEELGVVDGKTQKGWARVTMGARESSR
jgi:hypothetical protein